VLVAPEDPVKWCRLRVTNRSDRTRHLTIAVYLEWVLGADRSHSAANVVTQFDTGTGALLARNATSVDFGQRVAFCDLGGHQKYVTCNRREFLGRNGQLSAPAGLDDVTSWSGRGGAGFDPCGAIAVTLELQPGETQDFHCLLGQSIDHATATALIGRYRALAFDAVLAAVRDKWSGMLDAVQIRTPDRAVNLLFNRWLLYQTISCRLWGRAGFYQAGGAYGFRDQLQDGMAVAFANPAITRAHLLRAAARQFPEGDVQHWWHPPSGRGVRTHFSDDRIWLPYAVSQYVTTSGDLGVLEVPVAFVEGELLPLEREDAHFQPKVSANQSSLFEHCARALDASLLLGVHGLPLIGGGDWNDGMNRVGHHGRGESIWLAWFLILNLRQFANIAVARGDIAYADRWRLHADTLTEACELHGWDGAWYRRAFFDDGSPLGSAANAECRIDSLAQSWAVLSGAANPQRAARAMESVEHHLVRGGDSLVLLFAPPFAHSRPDPGYVQAYLPGVRENGGQYTHAAVWVLMAQAALGNQAQVAALLDMLNPIRRTESRSGMQAYRVEPYVVAADIYSMPPHARRGGWTWYTGASGWFYQAILESVLGVRVRGNTISIKPCLPGHWPGFEVDLKVNGADYVIEVVRVSASQTVGIELDGVHVVSEIIPLHADGSRHRLLVRIA
jgi:cyclic beta-1,2-glucan synthetase